MAERQRAPALDAAGDEIESRIAARNAARKAKDFEESDRIRDELAAHGRGAEGLQGRHHLGGRAMSARGQSQARAAAVSAAGRAAAGRDLPRQHRGADRGRLQRRRSRRPGRPRPTTWRRSPRGWRKQLTLVATWTARRSASSRSTAPTEIDLLYVHPAVAGQGVGTMLCDAIEKLAAARGTPQLVGRCQRHRARLLRASRLTCRSSATPCRSATNGCANTTMEKKLTPKGSTP